MSALPSPSVLRAVLAALAGVLLLSAAVPGVAEEGRVTAGSNSIEAVEPTPPDIVPRAAWNTDGACPRVVDETTAPRRLHLHHTHEPVVDAPDEAPDALRRICQGHLRRGFSDIGYHYLVDPYGRVWQGRGPLPGEVDGRVPTGAHAQGFNDHSIGIAMIGDYETEKPTDAAVDALVELMGWLSYTYDLDAGATDKARSTGGSATRFPEGHVVELPTVLGHRDTGKDTACPGQHLYDMLDEIRKRAGQQAELWAAADPGRAVDRSTEPGKVRSAPGKNGASGTAVPRDEPPARRGVADTLVKNIHKALF